jgi:ABC-type enterobactin transport system permease subunit
VSVFLRLKLVGVMLPVAVKLNAVVVSLAGSVTFLMTMVPGVTKALLFESD